MKKLLSIFLLAVLLLQSIPFNVWAEAAPAKTVGDMDLDGEITDWDGVLLARHLAGWTVNVVDEKILDIDGDGEITDWDGVMFDRHLAGWSAETQVGKRLAFTITYINTKNAYNPNPTVFEAGSEGLPLSDISAAHYRFNGWYVGDNKITHVPTNYESDLTISARWTPYVYTLSYANTKGANNPNPVQYHIESGSIVLQDLTCDGYRFDGWYINNSKVMNIPTGSTGDRVLTAKWTPCDYTVTYENTKGAINSNPNGFNTDSATVTLTDLSKEGYHFDGWYNGSQKVTTIPTGTIGNLTLTACWTPISYTATFIADGNVVATRYFTIEDTFISDIPNVPSKAGYVGAWSGYSIAAKNITIPAIYSLNEYTISYSNTKGADNSNPVSYTVITDTFNLADLQSEGYDFLGWYRGSTKVTSIEKGTTGSISLTAKWSATDYTITYTDTKGAVNANPVTYNVETGTIYLKDIAADHYTFDGWYLNGKKVTAIAAGNMGDIELVARWIPVSYNLTYLNTKGEVNTNPATYTVEDMIILQELCADGYTFDGWYIGDEKVTAIPVGSHGGKTLTARWTPITYSITYQGTKGVAHDNCNTYTIESNPITLSSLSVTGYTFDGWYNGNEKVTVIQTGTFGDLVLTAKWTPITYTITYQNTKDAANNNLTGYTMEDELVLEELVVNGYKFDGWYLGENRIEKIELGTYGDIELTAKWTLVTYSITYDDVKGVENSNPLQYTIETETFVLQSLPSVVGYTFTGWKMEGSTVTQIQAGTSGDLVISAVWTPITYNIKYITQYDATHSNPSTYTAEQTVTLNAATFDEYHTFEGWYTDSAFQNPITQITAGTTGDLTLYAKWSFDGAYIYTAEDFAQIQYNPSGNYELCADITISAAVCDADNPFTGYFFGNDHMISGMFTVFGKISGTVTHVKTAGRLADTNGSGGTVSYCIGRYGLVNNNGGYIYCSGAISNSSYYTSSSGWSYTGGLVAYNTGTIRECYSTSSFTSGADWVGGLVGYNNGTIENCYATGTITVNYYDYLVRAGGLVGECWWDGEIKNCYSSCQLMLNGKKGEHTYGAGLVCRLTQYSFSKSTEITNCFFVGQITSNYYYSDHTTPIAFTELRSSEPDYYANKSNYAVGSGTSSNCSFTSEANFSTPNFIRNTMGWDDTIWHLENGKLPTLAWEH